MVDLHIWEFPLSLSLAAAFIALVLLLGLKMRGKLIVRIIAGRKFSVVMLALLAFFIAVEGTLGLRLFHSWPFLVIVLLTMLSLGIATLDALKAQRCRKIQGAAGGSLASILSHGGLFLILFAGFFGAPDFREGEMIVSQGSSEHMAYSERGEYMPLPFSLTLKDFVIDTHYDGISAKQYTSTMEVSPVLADSLSTAGSGQGGAVRTLRSSVNHPAHYRGYGLFQADFDQYALSYSVIKIVRDPWLPLVYIGMAILALAAFLEVRRTWRGRMFLPVVIVLALLFTVVTVAKINFGTLMPALRSIWFVPHLLIYMIAYAVLAMALIFAVVSFFKPQTAILSRKFLSTASSLLIIGMLCGAVWAKAAWGDYWTWDAKECWAAVTWLLTLIGTHIPVAAAPRFRRRFVAVFVAILLSFLAMQITWYGVNYLPSAQNSLHTYNN